MKRQTVFITGANSDIGLAVVKFYIDSGYRVIGQYRSQNPEFSELMNTRENLDGFKFDLSNAEKWEYETESNGAIFNNIDVFIHLASELIPRCYENSDVSLLNHIISVNFLSANSIIRSIISSMQKRKFGRIVLASSIGVKFGGGAESYAYSLTKHMLEFMPHAHHKWAVDNILINTLRIGVTDTKLHKNLPAKNMTKRIGLIPMGRMAMPIEIANAIIWLASSENTYITGQTIDISGGE